MGTAREVFNLLVAELQNLYGKEEATSVVRILFREKLGISRFDFAIKKEPGLKETDIKILNDAKARLLQGEPIQYIIGKVHFSDCVLRVNKNVLIPRPETEELVQNIINDNKDTEELYILDIGTGSGCIAIALAKHLPNSHVTAIDNSQKALELAQVNAISNKVNIDFQNIDILNQVAPKKLGSFNIIVSNPPYIKESEKALMHVNVLDHEPHSALFVPDNEPLIFYEKIAALASKKLIKGGMLYFEINEAMGMEINKVLKRSGFTEISISKDLQGKDRFIRASL